VLDALAISAIAASSVALNSSSLCCAVSPSVSAREKLSRNNGVIASFSRALTEGLTAQQSDEEFNATLDAAVAEIAKASAT